jgi:uncharacterized protein DUF5658
VKTGQHVNGRPAAQPSALLRPSRQLWALFWLLALLQAMDLATTYLALAGGGTREGNPAFRRLLFTPAAPLIKGFVLVFFAILIVSSTNRGRPAPGHLLIASRVLVILYLIIVGHNVTLAMRFY